MLLKIFDRMAYWSPCSQIYHFYMPLTSCDLIISNLEVPDEMQISCHRKKPEMPRKLLSQKFVMTHFNVITSSSQAAWSVSQGSLDLGQTCSAHAGGNIKDRPPAVCAPLPPPIIIHPPTRLDSWALADNSISRQQQWFKGQPTFCGQPPASYHLHPLPPSLVSGLYISLYGPDHDQGGGQLSADHQICM